jgi:2-oxo-4-hydroxy-4-carboxy-5-ureidoimidazoline decarboxylase
MTPQISLDTLNKASQGEFVAALGGIFEHSPWIAETVATQRPFPSLGALYDAMKKAVNASGDDRKLALIKVHPDLAGKAAQAGTMTDESKSEQGSIGLDRLSPAEFQRFQTLNAAYAEKFHFPFIACVRRHTKESIFEAFETRLKNDRQQEYATALMEIFRIAGLRLDQLVAAPDKLTIA